MEWYGEGVGNAIVACRQNKALFVVYIYDESTASKTTDESWESSDVIALMTSNKCVALRILKDSLECRQFSQLFPVFLYPSVFCIGLTGQVLVSMSGGQSLVQLRDKLTDGFRKLQEELLPPVEAASLQAAPTISVTTPTLEEMGEDMMGSASPEQSPSLDDKVQRAKDLIKQQREEREEEQLEKEKKRELERRKMSKESVKFRKLHEDQRKQEWIQERQKQREDAKRVREEIKAKLEQDKLERQARSLEQRERNLSTPPISSVKSPVSASETCRIQLKLPDGNSSVVELNRIDTLSTLRRKVAEVVNESEDKVILTIMYPRKDLTRECNEQTMLQLQLVPSGVVIVRLTKGFVSSLKTDNGDSGVWGALAYIFQLIVGFLTFIKNAIAGLFGGGSPQDVDERKKSDIRRERFNTLSRGSWDNSSNNKGARLRKFRQEDYQDESDEERRKQSYNGNSTQQQ